MQYMLLIYNEPGADQSEMEEWFAYTNELREAGVYVGGEPLDDVASAVTVRVRNGETLSTKGPFAETSEVLGGYYTVEVDSIDEAQKWAAKIPSARYGSVEVRLVPPLPAPE